jgi:hypothetical protein
MKMRALWSEVVFFGFFQICFELLQNGHFKNVQNRFPNNKPRKVNFHYFIINSIL